MLSPRASLAAPAPPRIFRAVLRGLVAIAALAAIPPALPFAGAAPAPKAAAKSRAQADPFDQSQLAGLEWRNIGPYRGGRVTAVTGVAGQRNVYYFGGTGSGIWKSVDSGVTWGNVSDGRAP